MRRDSNVVLGIDAAWTNKEPSGVALLVKRDEQWRCIKFAPSYEAFCGDFTWDDRFSGSVIDVSAILRICQDLVGDWPSAVAVDMPLAKKKIDKRRNADNEVSSRFGHCKCGVHSPNSQRPGNTGRKLQQGFFESGYYLATKEKCQSRPALIEVYPHVALLGITGRCERLPYKVGKTKTYWPDLALDERKQRLFKEWKRILEHLGRHIEGISIDLPKEEEMETRSLQHLKRYEDAIDALVCAWGAVQFIENAACPMGDREAAIWIPEVSMKYAKGNG